MSIPEIFGCVGAVAAVFAVFRSQPSVNITNHIHSDESRTPTKKKPRG